MKRRRNRVNLDRSSRRSRLCTERCTQLPLVDHHQVTRSNALPLTVKLALSTARYENQLIELLVACDEEALKKRCQLAANRGLIGIV